MIKKDENIIIPSYSIHLPLIFDFINQLTMMPHYLILYQRHNLPFFSFKRIICRTKQNKIGFRLQRDRINGPFKRKRRKNDTKAKQ
jgi:hypothetical protein